MEKIKTKEVDKFSFKIPPPRLTPTVKVLTPLERARQTVAVQSTALEIAMFILSILYAIFQSVFMILYLPKYGIVSMFSIGIGSGIIVFLILELSGAIKRYPKRKRK